MATAVIANVTEKRAAGGQRAGLGTRTMIGNRFRLAEVQSRDVVSGGCGNDRGGCGLVAAGADDCHV